MLAAGAGLSLLLLAGERGAAAWQNIRNNSK